MTPDDPDQPTGDPPAGDNDARGTVRAEDRGRHLAVVPQGSVRTAEQILADLDAHGQLQALHTAHDQATTGPVSEQKGDARSATERDAGDGPRSQASRLVALAHESYRFVLGEDGRAYAVDTDGPTVAVPLRGRDSLRQRLARTYYARTGTAPSASALADALTVIEGETAALDPVPVALRVARHGDQVLLDLGDPTGRVITAGPHGWRLLEASPVLFRRTALTAPLPIPGLGRGMDELRALLNVDDARFGLIVGWLLAALVPDIPHPILAVTGEQGTAKSTAARFLVSLIDPSPAPLRTPPRDVRQWVVTAAASWTVALDNVSIIAPWLSDTLCRAVTGEGMVDRALFTDDDVTVLAFRRAVVMTSIDAGALAGDLAERLVPVELDRITPDQRRPDAEIEQLYQTARPGTLGALLDLLVDVLAALPGVRLEQLPRMADFARLLAALDTVTGWTTLATYTAATDDVTDAVLDADPIAGALRALLAGQAVGWAGTAAELLQQITSDTAPKAWPRTPRALAGKVRRLAPALRAAGIDVDFTRASDAHGTRLITLQHETQPLTLEPGSSAVPGFEQSPRTPSEPSEPSEHPP